MKEPFYADSIRIKNNQAKIEIHQDGSLLFSDQHVPGLRLIDIASAFASGGQVILDPVNIYTLEAYDPDSLENDWEVADDDEELFDVKLYHNWNLCDPEKVLVLTYEEHNGSSPAEKYHELIYVNSIRCFKNYVLIQTTNPVKMKVLIKRL
ncbi:MAG: hypothetical protein NZZ41_04905 [Candidatus Dojkabacteria bacterium]|nr:hypothetical protein [Candidatus Dojkabacteria bacterium]